MIPVDSNKLLLPRGHARSALPAGRHRRPLVHAAAGTAGQARRHARRQGPQS